MALRNLSLSICPFKCCGVFVCFIAYLKIAEYKWECSAMLLVECKLWRVPWVGVRFFVTSKWLMFAAVRDLPSFQRMIANPLYMHIRCVELLFDGKNIIFYSFLTVFSVMLPRYRHCRLIRRWAICIFVWVFLCAVEARNHARRHGVTSQRSIDKGCGGDYCGVSKRGRLVLRPGTISQAIQKWVSERNDGACLG